ncbi:lamin-L(I)-like [Ixodes scapularis]|uniref:lamin-L(I)-like n=1 Tax=Ixodes scapularis TaxID=6945 RepID=UPI001A9EB49A|nr:lamin-L(I)-like [Ixodes scapularis]
MTTRSVGKQAVTTTTTTTTSSSHNVSQQDLGDGPSNPASPRSSVTNAGGSRERSHSPHSASRVSRIQEKNNLAYLNDRLAKYMDHVRHLESENSNLTEQVKTSQEIHTWEVVSVKILYDRQLAYARHSVDLTANEKAKLQLEAKKLQTKAETLQAILAKREREGSVAERRVTSLQSQNVDLQERLNQALAQLKDAEEERGAMAKMLEKLRKELEAETLRNVELRNRAMTLSEFLNFLTPLYENVWSSDAGATHSPPSDLVMRNQQWPHGEQMSTALLSADGEEVRVPSVLVFCHCSWAA